MSPGNERTDERTASDDRAAGPAVPDSLIDAAASSDADRWEPLLAEMTLEEKVGQMTQVALDTLDPDEMDHRLTELNVGSFVFDGGRPPDYDPAALSAGIRRLQRRAVEQNAHGIPFLVGLDAVHGNATVDGAVVFPHNSGVGASRNPELARELGAVTARSVEAIGGHWNFAPTTDVARDPRWGRFYECYSDDPYVVGTFAAAAVEGIEGPGPGARVLSSVKHFAGYSAPENGNDRSPANVSLRDLRTNLLPPYERAIAAGAETVMANSGSVNGVPGHASEWLLQTVLRDRWGFDGLVVSDWADLERMRTFHRFVSSDREAIRRGLLAGVDVYMRPSDPERFVELTVDLVRAGEVPAERIDDAVRNVLDAKAAVGLFEAPTADPDRAPERVAAGRDLAREAAVQSITLLENDGGALPLSPDVDSLLLTGPATEAVEMLTGAWTLGWQTIGDVDDIDAAPAVTSLREAVEDRVASETLVRHEPTGASFDFWGPKNAYSFENREAVREAAAAADAVVVAIGEAPHTEFFGDRDDLSLAEPQRELVETLARETDASTPLVGVLFAGRPRGSAETFDRLDALLMAYQPGTAGGPAVADVLFGDRSPSGRLPFTWPASVGMVPSYGSAPHEPRSLPEEEGGTGDLLDRDPLFEAGRGLSYADFEYRDLVLEPATVTHPADRGHVDATVTVENVGDRSADLAVDLEARGAYGSVMHPSRRIVGFDRVEADPGERVETTIRVPLRALEVIPGQLPGVEEAVVEAGEYELRVGDRNATLTIERTESVTGRGPVAQLER